jgi:hypothetical protein
MERIINDQLPPVPPPPDGLSPSQREAWLGLMPVLTVAAYENITGTPLVALLTGEAGSGKTWLAARMREAAETWWAAVDRMHSDGGGEEIGDEVEWSETPDDATGWDSDDELPMLPRGRTLPEARNGR